MPDRRRLEGVDRERRLNGDRVIPVCTRKKATLSGQSDHSAKNSTA